VIAYINSGGLLVQVDFDKPGVSALGPDPVDRRHAFAEVVRHLSGSTAFATMGEVFVVATELVDRWSLVEACLCADCLRSLYRGEEAAEGATVRRGRANAFGVYAEAAPDPYRHRGTRQPSRP